MFSFLFFSSLSSPPFPFLSFFTSRIYIGVVLGWYSQEQMCPVGHFGVFYFHIYQMLHYFPLLSSMQSLWYHASLVALDGLSSPARTLELVWIPCQLVSLCYPCMGFDFAIYCSVFKLELGEIKELHCHHHHHQGEIFFSLFYSPSAIISCYFQFLWSGVCL